MRTATVILLALSLLITGCSSSRLSTGSDQQTELISLTPLPTLTTPTAFGIKIIVLFRVSPEGVPAEVSMLRSSGDPDWDRPAVDSLMQWRFAPITGDREKGDRWIRYAVVVQVQEPTLMRLAEMILPSRERAEAIYAQLQGGASFDSLGKALLTGGTEGAWKPVELINLTRFPSHVREALCPLSSNQVTEPIRVGPNYVIFKRYHQPN
jgi:TonB family protein